MVPVPVDDEGFDISIGEESAADALMAYVTPLHQFPTGVTLSLTRRLALVDGLRRRIGDGSRLGAADIGLHLLLYTPGRDDVAISRRAARASMDLPALSQYYLGPTKRSGLLVTFANEPATRADGTAERIAKLL